MEQENNMLEKKVLINMPQMAVEALSENWLFKELGDMHWALICKGLNTKSFDLTNDSNSRLYATFVRIRLFCSGSLKSFVENEEAVFNGRINRFGESMYFSNIDFATKNASISAELMTTFSIRDAVDNTSLAKSEPDVSVNNVPVLKRFPEIGNQYRQVKKRVMTKIENEKLGFSFDVNEVTLHSFDYDLNPFYDINGVNLLYFAAYPIINDYCESKVMNNNYMEIDEQWEQNYSTKYKDVFYYANCNVNDSLIYELCSIDHLENGLVKLGSLLRRKSDQAIIARVFTLKQRFTS